MNQTQIIGRLTKEPELRKSGEICISRFTVAVNRPYKNKEGAYEADFISCVAFSKTAELICDYFKKGSKIGLVGRIQTGSYTNKEGNKVYTTDVVVEHVEFIDSKSSSTPEVTAPEVTAPEDTAPEVTTDEDLPFM